MGVRVSKANLAAAVALETVIDFLREDESLDEVVFVLFDDEPSIEEYPAIVGQLQTDVVNTVVLNDDAAESILGRWIDHNAKTSSHSLKQWEAILAQGVRQIREVFSGPQEDRIP